MFSFRMLFDILRNNFFFILLIVFLVIIYFIYFNPTSINQVKGEPKFISNENKIEPPNFKYGFLLDEYNFIKGKVKPGESIYSILDSLGISLATIDRITHNTDTLFDFTQIRPSKEYLLLCSKDTTQTPLYFVYEKSLVEYIVFGIYDTKDIYVEKREVEQRILTLGSSIKSSLWNAIIEQKKSPVLAVRLEDIYKWTIDFFGIQKNDNFKLIYKQDFVAGKPIGNIIPLAACFNHRKKPHYAFYYKDKSTNNAGFYDEFGIDLQRSFLKAPLNYTRVSSIFSHKRYHPVLRIYRPHHGVDYAAPIGTPVHSVAKGFILKMGYQRGGAGRYIKIKHSETLTTIYMHFQRFAKNIYKGKIVKQGEVIGYVGSSGLSTGPHLDFRIYKNGKPVNPLNFVSPNVKPIMKEKLSLFKSYKDSLMLELQAVTINTNNKIAVIFQ